MEYSTTFSWKSFLIMCVLLTLTAHGKGHEHHFKDLVSFPAIDVKGIVTDQQGQPLIGVNVLVKGTTKGTSTDFDGNFTLSDVEENATLVFSYIGYQTLEVELEGRSSLLVEMSSDAQMLDELIVVGYGTVKKSDLTGSVSTISGETFKDQPVTQVSEMLTGTVAGFYATQGTSASGGSSLEVRGPNSLNASSTPMIVLDGVIYNGSLKDINPNDIESIDILKDASSAAVYGARAASGVVIISTKMGGDGKPVVQFSTQLGSADVTGRFEPFQGEEYLNYRRDVLRVINPGFPAYYFNDPSNLPSGVTIDQWRSASDNPLSDDVDEYLSRLNFYQIESKNYKDGKVVDWFDEVMQTGFRQNYDLSVSGGTESLKYYWSLGYQNNEGVIKGDEFGTIRSRLNLDYTISEWLNVGLNTQYSHRDESSVLASVGAMYNMSPYGDIFEENGDVKWFPNTFIVANPLIDYYGQEKLRNINSIFSNIYANVGLPFDINYKLSFQPRFEFLKDYNFWSDKTFQGGRSRSGGYATRRDGSDYSWILDNILSWQKEVGIHNFDVTLLYSSEKNQGWSSYLENQSFVPNQNLGFGGLAFGTNPSLNSSDYETTGDAAMARLNYTLLNRYLFTVSVRRDGYSAFGNKYPRATFPAAAFAWKMSDESFFESDLINSLKLRLSWGVNGNREIGAYSALARLSSTLYYDGSNVRVGVFNNTLANKNLRWEKTQSFNIGLDVGMVNGRINTNLDLYKMNTTDLLLNRLVPELSGYRSVTANLGELQNIGLDLSFNSVNIDHENFRWNSNVVFSLNRNKIVELFGDQGTYTLEGKEIQGEVPDYSNEWFPGHAIDHIWDYNITGIWQENEKDAAAEYRLNPGDIKAVDVNNDGKFEELEDKQFIGYTRPRFRVGMRQQFTFFKNFDASVFLRGDLGHMKSFNQGLRLGGVDTYDRRNSYKTPYWTPSNPINDFPSLTNNVAVYGGGISFYKSASFVRIQDISLGYNVSDEWAQRLMTRSIRVYGSIRNLYSFNQWPGWDPESLNSPMPRIFSIGLDVTLN